MDTLCGVGLPELIILALIGFVVIGPERSQEVALTAGRWLRSIMTSAWWKEFNQITTSIRTLPNALVRMAELEEAQADITRAVDELSQATQIDLGDLDDSTPRPPKPETIDDPWGIRNATAQTTFTPRPMPPDQEPKTIPTSPDDNDAHDR